MNWFRFYPEILHDPDIQTLPPDQFKTWVNLLCLAAKEHKGGRLPAFHSIAFRLRMTEETAIEHCAALDRAGLLRADGGVYAITDWDRYEPPEADRQTPEYRTWRAAILLRDDYTCQRCGATGKEAGLHAHHKSGYRNDRAGRFLLANGITLCADCHRAEHSRKGNR